MASDWVVTLFPSQVVITQLLVPNNSGSVCFSWCCCWLLLLLLLLLIDCCCWTTGMRSVGCVVLAWSLVAHNGGASAPPGTGSLTPLPPRPTTDLPTCLPGNTHASPYGAVQSKENIVTAILPPKLPSYLLSRLHNMGLSENGPKPKSKVQATHS